MLMLTMCLNAVSHACHCQHIAIVTASAVAKHVHAVVGMLYIIEQITHKLVKYGKYKRYVMYTRRPVQNWMKINSIGSKCVAKQLATTGHEKVAQYDVGLTSIDSRTRGRKQSYHPSHPSGMPEDWIHWNVPTSIACRLQSYSLRAYCQNRRS